MGNGPIAAKHNPFASRDVVGLVEFTFGAEGSNIRNVAIQLQDVKGNDLAVRASVLVYLSDDAEGDDLTATAATSIAIGTDGVAILLVAAKAYHVISEVDGDIDLAVEYTGGAKTWYVNVIMPDGSIITSSALTFA